MSWPLESTLLPKPGDTVAGKYVIQRVIGSGGMSVVFGATHNLTHKRVAIKWLVAEPGVNAADATKRFMREARMAGHFQHPNIVQIYDFGESDGSFFMVMEWLDGESLASRLERDKRLSFVQMCEYMIPCMRAMQRAHAAGIIHRDLKPANIFLCTASTDKPEHAKVLDFGISKLITQSAQLTSLVTKSGMVIGTPHYLSPEQLRARAIDARTDIYGFGVILYQCLSGELPFPADNFGDLAVQIAMGAPRPLEALVPGLPAGVAELVSRAMAREPTERFQDMAELIAALEELARRASLPPALRKQLQLSHPPDPGTPARDSRPRPQRTLLVSLLVLLGLAALAAAAGMFHLYSGGNTRVADVPAHSAAPPEPQPRSPGPDRGLPAEPPQPTGSAAPPAELPAHAAEAAQLERAAQPAAREPTLPSAAVAEPGRSAPEPAEALPGTAPAAHPKPAPPRAQQARPAATPKPSAAPSAAAPSAHEAGPAPDHNPLHMTIQ